MWSEIYSEAHGSQMAFQGQAYVKVVYNLRTSWKLTLYWIQKGFCCFLFGLAAVQTLEYHMLTHDINQRNQLSALHIISSRSYIWNVLNNCVCFKTACYKKIRHLFYPATAVLAILPYSLLVFMIELFSF